MHWGVTLCSQQHWSVPFHKAAHTWQLAPCLPWPKWSQKDGEWGGREGEPKIDSALLPYFTGNRTILVQCGRGLHRVWIPGGTIISGWLATALDEKMTCWHIQFRWSWSSPPGLLAFRIFVQLILSFPWVLCLNVIFSEMHLRIVPS